MEAKVMKMYVQPLDKETLERYLAVADLTQAGYPHAIKLLYEKIAEHVRNTHQDSEVVVVRQKPIVKVEDNYDNLLIRKDNISRSSTYTHYVDKERILRTHTSAHIPAILKDLATRTDWKDIVILLPGLAYRRDVTDKKHLGILHQLDMWRVVRNKDLKVIEKSDLLNVIKGVAQVAAPGWKLRIVDNPHPYTKEGIEVNAVKGDSDIEILEAGLINDEILRRAGLDPQLYSGWASGMGLDRLVMTLKGIPDIRYLRSTNPAIAKQMTNLETYHEVSHQPAIKRDMSYSVPKEYVEEDINEDIRQALGNSENILESVEVLSETAYKDLPPHIRQRLGINSKQKNVLVRITLRHLERSLTNQEANHIYNEVYDKINYGTGGYL
jgi:phenylalanyl-tRNA synthetase alpha chain